MARVSPRSRQRFRKAYGGFQKWDPPHGHEREAVLERPEAYMSTYFKNEQPYFLWLWTDAFGRSFASVAFAQGTTAGAVVEVVRLSSTRRHSERAPASRPRHIRATPFATEPRRPLLTLVPRRAAGATRRRCRTLCPTWPPRRRDQDVLVLEGALVQGPKSRMAAFGFGRARRRRHGPGAARGEPRGGRTLLRPRLRDDAQRGPRGDAAQRATTREPVVGFPLRYLGHARSSPWPKARPRDEARRDRALCGRGHRRDQRKRRRRGCPSTSSRPTASPSADRRARRVAGRVPDGIAQERRRLPCRTTRLGRGESPSVFAPSRLARVSTRSARSPRGEFRALTGRSATVASAWRVRRADRRRVLPPPAPYLESSVLRMAARPPHSWSGVCLQACPA